MGIPGGVAALCVCGAGSSIALCWHTVKWGQAMQGLSYREKESLREGLA